MVLGQEERRMKAIGQNTMQAVPAMIWRLLFAVAFVYAGCGERGLRSTGRDAAQGGSTSPSGGRGGSGGTETGGVEDASSAGGAGASSTGETVVATGGVAFQGGNTSAGQDGGATDGETVATSDALCQLADFWDAIRQGRCSGDPFCFCYSSPADGRTSLGVVYLDGEGRAVDNTGLYGTWKQAWLDALANQRWPCLANQHISYSCSLPG